MLKVIFLGATNFSKELLSHLVQNNICIDAIFTIPEGFNISYSEGKVKNFNYANMWEQSIAYDIPCFEVDSVGGKRLTDYYDLITSIKPDVILVMGWYYMVPKKIRELAKFGAWGIHASMLPKYAGGAPLVWAIINGETKTGVTLFKLDDGVDDGDIIAQQEITIEFQDSIKDVYDKATEASKKILLEALENINLIQPVKQDKSKIEVFPQRNPSDGEINLNWPADKIYNFIRAQAPPYPGAFFKTKDGKKLIIHKATIEEE